MEIEQWPCERWRGTERSLADVEEAWERPSRQSGQLEALMQPEAPLDQMPLWVAKGAERMWPAAAQSGGVMVGNIDISLSKAHPCISDPVPLPGPWALLAKLTL